MRLFSKLFLILIALGAMGLGLLALRQQRYEVSNEISRAHNRIVEQERAQWRMRAEIAGESALLAATPADTALGGQVVSKVTSSEAAIKAATTKPGTATAPAAKKSSGSKSSTTGNAKAGTRER